MEAMKWACLECGPAWPLSCYKTQHVSSPVCVCLFNTTMEIKENLLPWFGWITLGNFLEELRNKVWTISVPDKHAGFVFAVLKSQTLSFRQIKRVSYYWELHLQPKYKGLVSSFSAAGSHIAQAGLKLDFWSRLVLNSWSFPPPPTRS